MRHPTAAAWTAALIAIAGCGSGSSGNSDDTSDAACGDVDGPGGDTGDIPPVLGKWTVEVGRDYYDTGVCDLEGFQRDDLTWLAGTMEIDGRMPDKLFAYFDEREDERYWAAINHLGGIVFTGTREVDGHMLYISFGGHIFETPQVDRDNIRGMLYIGIDEGSEDAIIDCWIVGDYIAFKSGN